MALNVQYPKSAFGRGMNPNPGSYGTGTILSGQPYVAVDCGELNDTSIVKVAQIGSSASLVGPICELKYSGADAYQRTDGLAGQFYVGTVDGANATADIDFEWFVLPLGMQ